LNSEKGFGLLWKMPHVQEIWLQFTKAAPDLALARAVRIMRVTLRSEPAYLPQPSDNSLSVPTRGHLDQGGSQLHISISSVAAQFRDCLQCFAARFGLYDVTRPPQRVGELPIETLWKGGFVQNLVRLVYGQSTRWNKATNMV